MALSRAWLPPCRCEDLRQRALINKPDFLVLCPYNASAAPTSVSTCVRLVVVAGCVSTLRTGKRRTLNPTRQNFSGNFANIVSCRSQVVFDVGRDGQTLQDERLDCELQGFAAAVRPRKADRDRRALLLSKIEAAAKSKLGPDVLVCAYGPAVSGLGEKSEPVHVCMYVPVTPDRMAALRTAGLKRAGAALARESMKGILALCGKQDIYVAGTQSTPRGLQAELELRMETPEAEASLGEPNQCYLRCQELLPLYSTRLLRSYAELEPRLPVVVMVVMRWMEANGLAEEGLISKFGWTLLVVYYFQVCCGLPSLHQVHAQLTGSKLTTTSANTDFTGAGHEVPMAIEFADAMQAVAVTGNNLTNLSTTKPGSLNNFGALLQGFFEFYTANFVWGEEVVSVRLGSRDEKSSINFTALQAEAQDNVGLIIEDPIEVHRDLGASMNGWGMCALRAALLNARAALAEGRGLADLFMIEQDEVPQQHPFSLERATDGLLDPYATGDFKLRECDVCHAQLRGNLVLLQHQVDTGHCQCSDKDSIKKLRARDADGVGRAFERLQAALKESSEGKNRSLTRGARHKSGEGKKCV